MSGENRRFSGWQGAKPEVSRSGANRQTDPAESRIQAGHLLPVLIVIVGACFLITGMQAGTLSAAVLKPVNWAGIALMAVGAAGAFLKRPAAKLLGVMLCGVGAILVICL